MTERDGSTAGTRGTLHAVVRCLVGTALAAVALAATPAAADPHKLLVLQSEGRADAATRARVDAAIVKLASNGDVQVSAGELNFSDAATAVGCQPDAATCKDEVLGMLAVDEIVITSLSPRPGGIDVAVRRVSRSASREATVLLASGGAPDQLEGLAVLFATPLESPDPIVPPPSAVAPEVRPSPIVTAPVEGEPANHDRQWQIAGMAGGGGLLVLGLVMWSAAGGIQHDIDEAPTTTRDDLAHLQDLESRADTYATLGNVLTVTGLAVGGFATYFYVRDRRAASVLARLRPTVLDRGAGLVVTFGASP